MYYRVIAFLLLVCAVLLRWTIHGHLPIVMTRDSFGYLDIARVIADSWNLTDALPHRVPGYSVFLNLLFLVFGESGVVVTIVQSLLGIVTAGLLGLVARDRISPLAGLLVFALIALSPAPMVLENVLLTETLFRFLIAVAIYSLHRAPSGNGWSLLCSLSVTASVLTRPSGLPLAVVLLAGLLFLTRKQLYKSALAVCLGTLPLFIWVAAVYQATGVLHLTASAAAGKFEGYQLMGLLRGRFEKFEDLFPITGEAAEINISEPFTHYQAFDALRNAEISKNPELGLKVFSKTEQLYKNAITKIDSTLGTEKLLSQIFSLRVLLGLGPKEIADMPWYFEALDGRPERSKPENCEIYGNAASLKHAVQNCITATPDRRRTMITGRNSTLSVLLLDLYWGYSLLIGVIAIGSICALAASIAFSRYRCHWNGFLAALLIAVWASSLAHAYYLAPLGRYLEAVSHLWLLAGVMLIDHCKIKFAIN